MYVLTWLHRRGIFKMSRFALIGGTFRVTLPSNITLGLFAGVLIYDLITVQSVSSEESQTTLLRPPRPSELIASLTPEEFVSLRDSVAYQISMGRSLEISCQQIAQSQALDSLAAKAAVEDLVAAMYDALTAVPEAPPQRPRAIALIGDRYHHPGYIRPPLERACQKLGLSVTFIYDVRLLNAQLLE